MSAYPRGVSYVPSANPNRPFQARVTWGGRRYSLGYFRSVLEAELAVSRVQRESAEWAEMQLPPPTLLRVLERQGRRARSQHPVAPADGMPAAEPLPSLPRSESPSSRLA